MTKTMPFAGLRMVVEGQTTSPEPPLDRDRWDDLDCLRWHAAVVREICGVRPVITRANYSVHGRRQHGYYNIGLRSSSCGPFRYWSAWEYLSGIQAGAVEAARAGEQA